MLLKNKMKIPILKKVTFGVIIAFQIFWGFGTIVRFILPSFNVNGDNIVFWSGVVGVLIIHGLIGLFFYKLLFRWTIKRK